MDTCYQCKRGTMKPTMYADELAIAGYVFHMDLPASKCDACGEVLIDGPAVGRAELRAARILLDGGVRVGSVLRFARKALGLSGKDLAALLGVRPETVSRWESDAIAPPEHAIVATLAAMVADELDGRDDTRKRLERYNAANELPRTIELTST